MPTAHKKITYTCDICGMEFGSKRAAHDCEKQGIAIPEFFERQVVALKDVRLDGQTLTHGIVYEEYFDDRPSPHLLPGGYAVHVKNTNPTAPHLKSTVIHVSREEMQEVTTAVACCPICSSTEVNIEQKKIYNPFNSPYFYIHEARVARCKNNCQEFLLIPQAETIKSAIREWAERVSKALHIADTQELIKTRSFYYS